MGVLIEKFTRRIRVDVELMEILVYVYKFRPAVRA